VYLQPTFSKSRKRSKNKALKSLFFSKKTGKTEAYSSTIISYKKDYQIIIYKNIIV